VSKYLLKRELKRVQSFRCRADGALERRKLLEARSQDTQRASFPGIERGCATTRMPRKNASISWRVPNARFWKPGRFTHTRPPANTGPLGSAEPRRAPHKTSALDQVSEQLLAHHSKLCPPVVTHAKDNSDGTLTK